MSKTKPKAALSYVNVHRSNKGYKDKYKKDVDIAIKKYAGKIGKKEDGSDFTNNEWKTFFKTNLLPLDKLSEQKMIELFKDNRDELNTLLILHNTKASDNLAEVYFKKYEKECPTQWHDLDDFKQMALEGLAIAAQRFDLNSGNKFITYATWWVLNRVRKPYAEKGAMVGHTSLNAPNRPFDEDSSTTLEDVFSSDMIAPDWGMGGDELSVNPATILDSKSTEENIDLYQTIRHIVPTSSSDSEQTSRMLKYLMSLVEKNKDSYNKKQIFLYMFRKIFNKCSSIMVGGDNVRLNSYISEAAKSKSELLKRLNMDEIQYKAACKTLINGCYNGL